MSYNTVLCRCLLFDLGRNGDYDSGGVPSDIAGQGIRPCLLACRGALSLSSLTIGSAVEINAKVKKSSLRATDLLFDGLA